MFESIALLVVLALAVLLVLAKAYSRLGKPGARRSRADGDGAFSANDGADRRGHGQDGDSGDGGGDGGGGGGGD